MKRKTLLKAGALAYFTALFAAAPLPALAYIDPSVSTYLISTIAGVAVAAGAFIALSWRRAKKKVQAKMGLDPNAGKEKEEAVEVYDEEDE